MTHLFTYGSLMCADIMHRVSGCQAQSTEAVLTNFHRSKICGEDYPGIVPRSGFTVQGVLYLSLSEEALRRLDIFEGDLYERQEVEVVSKEHGRCLAMTYVVRPMYRDRLSNEEWSYSHFLAVGKARFESTYLGFERSDSACGGKK